MDKQDIRDKIYRAGLEIFQTKGYSNTNIRAICKEAKVALGSFYNYYKSKRELYYKIFTNEYKKLSHSLIDNIEKNRSRGIGRAEVIEEILWSQLQNHNRTILFYIESEVLVLQDKELMNIRLSLKDEFVKILGDILRDKVRGDMDFNLGFPLIYTLVESSIQFTINKPKEIQRKLIKETAKMVIGYLF